MKSMFLVGCITAALVPIAAHAAEGSRTFKVDRSLAAQFKKADAASPGLANQLVSMWEKNLRELRGWDDGAIAHFRTEMQGMPSDTLKAALELRNWDTLQSLIMDHQGQAAAERLAQASADWRSGASLDETNLEEARLKRNMQKLLGDADKDLVFIPVQPCTTWDTRFALSGSGYDGLITAASNKAGFVYHSSAGAFDWTPYGGNPACDSTAIVATYGVIPYAVAYTLYTADATAQGWVTAYRDGDPDPSSATISLYYTPGPTRSTTVVTRVGRANANTYDIRIASQFGSVHAAVSVIGYFIRSAATALQCSDVTQDISIAAGARDFAFPTCAAGYTLVSGGVRAGANDNQFVQASAPNGVNGDQWFTSIFNGTAGPRTYTFTSRCCRVPGR